MEKKDLNLNKTPKGSSFMAMKSTNNREMVQTSTRTDERMIEHDLLIEEMGIPFLEVDVHLHILRWNQAFLELTNIKENELRMFTIKELGMEEKCFFVSSELIEKTFQLKSKQEIDFEEEERVYRIKAVPSSLTEVVYLIFEDRSLQKQFENLLTFHHQMEAVSHIAAGVAHELRNPLSVIKGFLQLAKLTNDHKKYYDTIMSELNRMNGILEDFLSVSRRKMDRRWQSPVTIMNSLIEIIKAECLLHDVEFKLELSETDKQVFVNESMVKQVMLNLLRNSVEAYGQSNNNRKLTIETKIHQDDYIIEVKDNGKGMPESILSQLGKPFFYNKIKGNWYWYSTL
ncbi:two-component system sensor histidine kinase NtrB [Halalkalibacter akibai]|uniref:Two-component sensor histidine kinase n=1 Tax=Halalkalibacter akibai (strain ATCC 43226 / DSM 21942 / CIP 109018 / JCM 9157 / 1139) TaxID=1236973 RepID=W4QNG7_HALA3|nr:histidine kinase dimerization/phospho-acceptor domain-containing protein [Halalkalibacter akibai]GAE33422.1 two-component sensor histidine kinase [Halalkalibacter akibai JCM 9157]